MLQGFKAATNIVAKITINTPIPPEYPALVTGQKRDVFVTDPIVRLLSPTLIYQLCSCYESCYTKEKLAAVCLLVCATRLMILLY